jgi:hypothetical protein
VRTEEEYADQELRLLGEHGHTWLIADYYPRDLELDFRVWASEEDVPWLRRVELSLGSTSHPDWPDFVCDKSDAADVTSVGYRPHSRVPLGRLIAAKALGVRRELLEKLDIWPADDCHLNVRRDNIMITPPSGEPRDAKAVASLAKAVEEYGDYVRYDLERLFLMTRRVE